MSNIIGKRGEHIFSMIISRHVSPFGHLFDPVFLGDKNPAVDFLVNLLMYHDKNLCFLASVKTTRQGYTGRSKLKIQVPADEIAELQKFQLPVYLFGIDEISELAYFVNAHHLDSAKCLYGLPVSRPVNHFTLQQLWKEVVDFYDHVIVESDVDLT